MTATTVTTVTTVTMVAIVIMVTTVITATIVTTVMTVLHSSMLLHILPLTVNIMATFTEGGPLGAWEKGKKPREPIQERNIRIKRVEAIKVIEVDGEKVKAIRESKGIFLSDMAEDVYISTPTLWKMERGEHEPDLRLLQRICVYLNVTKEEITK